MNQPQAHEARADKAAQADETEPSAPDYYVEQGRVVFTAAYHRRRGYCCGNGCRHCPYEGEAKRDRPIDADQQRAS